MILTSPDVAATLEAAEAWHLRVQAQTWRALDGVSDRAAPGIEIVRGDAARALFIQASIDGFSVQAQQRPRELLAALARIAHARDDTSTFVARIDGFGLAFTKATFARPCLA